jgi:hypothetical protein
MFCVIFVRVYLLLICCSVCSYRIGGALVSMHASSAVDRRFELRSVQTKVYKFGICCFSSKHAALRKKSKDWLARNQDSVSELGNTPTGGLLFQ